jgi:hypothetical protein
VHETVLLAVMVGYIQRGFNASPFQVNGLEAAVFDEAPAEILF